LESHTKELNASPKIRSVSPKDPDALIELEQLRKDEDEQREAERSAEAIAEAQGRTTAGLLD